MTNQEEIILVINPGSTSTKLAIYSGETEIHFLNKEHSLKDLVQFSTINDQISFRKKVIREFVSACDIKLTDLAAIAVRGGVIGKLESGAYLVDKTLAEASYTTQTPHPSNLAPVIGYQLAKEAATGIHAYMYDAVCGCGMPEEIFLFSGIPELERVFLTHVLNSRAVATEQAKRDNMALEDTTYIIVHMGGGITTNLLNKGKIVDLVADDEGTFSPERSGGVPCRKLVKLCYSGKYNEQEMQSLLKGKGGMMASLQTNDFCEVEKRIDAGDKKALLILRAMALQIAKDIGSLAPVVGGKIDKIVLTGALACSDRLVALISRRVEFLAEIAVIPGSFEMEALARGALRVLRNQEKAQQL